MSEDVDLHSIARGTSGFSGAELANLVNEATIFASREDSDVVSKHNFEKAKDKILMGVERKTFTMSEDERKLTAIHEAGHAVVGYFSKEHDPIYKVSIIPRGRALGITMFLPERDSVSVSKIKLESQIASLYGGRIAEEIYAGFDGVTTGASNDIERATSLATKMVTEWGMSKKVPPIKFVEMNGLTNSSQLKSGMEEITTLVQKEIQVLINKNYKAAERILKKNWNKVEQMAELLMERETIDEVQIENIMKG
jgi:cell division protease FtsH